MLLHERTDKVYFDPLAQSLAAVANLTVDSQVQFYAGLTFEPESRQNEYIVPFDKLPGFVNSAEWNLGRLYSDDANPSDRNHFIPCYKLYPLRPSSVRSTPPSRIHFPVNLLSRFVFPPAMGRNSNLQPLSGNKTS